MYEKLVNPYRTSRDYRCLYELLAERNEIVCFVDYRFSPDDHDPCRDVCTARCFADDDYIRIGARGIQYNSLSHLSQRAEFIADCERMRLEFIKPETINDEQSKEKESQTAQA